MLSGGLVSILIAATAYASPVALRGDEQKKLADIRGQIEQLSGEVSDLQRAFTSKQISVAALKKELASLERELVSSKEKRQRLEDIDSQDPGSVNPERLAQARLENDNTFSKKQQKNLQLKDATTALNMLQEKFEQRNSEDMQLKNDYESRVQTIVSRVVSERKNEFQKAQSVEATGIISCAEMAVKECKDKSMKEAERQAIERGSVIVIDSITEISNSTLTKDQIRSATRGRIASREILEAKFVNNDTAFQTVIRAQVTPGLSPELLEEMKTAARMDVEAQVGGGVLMQSPAAYKAPNIHVPVARIPSPASRNRVNEAVLEMDAGHSSPLDERSRNVRPADSPANKNIRLAEPSPANEAPKKATVAIPSF